MVTKETVRAELDQLTTTREGLNLIVSARGARINLVTAGTHIASARLLVDNNLEHAVALVAEARTYLQAAMEIHQRSKPAS